MAALACAAAAAAAAEGEWAVGVPDATVPAAAAAAAAGIAVEAVVAAATAAAAADGSDPIMVKVFPEPVCPYAKRHVLKPARQSLTTPWPMPVRFRGSGGTDVGKQGEAGVAMSPCLFQWKPSPCDGRTAQASETHVHMFFGFFFISGGRGKTEG